MKVLFLNYEYPPLGAGAANATAYLLEELAKQEGMEVHLVTSAVGKAYEKIPLGGAVTVHRIPIGKNPNHLHSQSLKDILVYTCKSTLYAWRLLFRARERFDITLAFFGVPGGFQALILKVIFGVPYVVALRGSDVPGYSEKYRFFYPLLRPLIRLIWSQAAAVIPNSTGLEALARKTAPEGSFHIIENGVDTNHFQPDPTKRPATEFIITPGASRVTERKGLHFLVEALARLAPQYPQLKLKIMGDGSARPGLEALVRERELSDRVQFLGRIPRDATAPYYQEASLFVLPSLNEGMSNAMLEALATGLPIIATDTGGTRELVNDGENGFVVPTGSIEALERALERIITEPDLVTRFGAESRRRAEARSWRMVAEQFRGLLEERLKK